MCVFVLQLAVSGNLIKCGQWMQKCLIVVIQRIVISSSLGQSFELSFHPLVDDPDQQKSPKEKYLDKFKEFWDCNLPLISNMTETTCTGLKYFANNTVNYNINSSLHHSLQWLTLGISIKNYLHWRDPWLCVQKLK